MARTEVFIVVIETKTLHDATKIGAVYPDRDSAQAEVERLRNANPYTKAYFVSRHVGMEP